MAMRPWSSPKSVAEGDQKTLKKERSESPNKIPQYCVAHQWYTFKKVFHKSIDPDHKDFRKSNLPSGA
jgi:hypothetical protein